MIEKYNFQKHKSKLNVFFTFGNKFPMAKAFLCNTIPCTILKLSQWNSTIDENKTPGNPEFLEGHKTDYLYWHKCNQLWLMWIYNYIFK